jgi:hypothetical protein
MKKLRREAHIGNFSTKATINSRAPLSSRIVAAASLTEHEL